MSVRAGARPARSGGDSFSAADYLKYLNRLGFDARGNEIRLFVQDVAASFAASRETNLEVEVMLEAHLRVISFAKCVVYHEFTDADAAAAEQRWEALLPEEARICQLFKLLAETFTKRKFGNDVLESEFCIKIVAGRITFGRLFYCEMSCFDFDRLPEPLLAIFQRLLSRKQQLEAVPNPLVAADPQPGAAAAAELPPAPTNDDEAQTGSNDALLIQINDDEIEDDNINAPPEIAPGPPDEEKKPHANKYYHQMKQVKTKELLAWLEWQRAKFSTAPRRKAVMFLQALKLKEELDVARRTMLAEFLDSFEIMARNNPEEGIPPARGARPKRKRTSPPPAENRSRKRRALNDIPF